MPRSTSRNGVGTCWLTTRIISSGVTPLAVNAATNEPTLVPDVDVELVDGAVDREQVERAQRADLVDAAGEAAAAEDERRLGSTPAAAGTGLRRLVRSFAALASSSTTLPMRLRIVRGRLAPEGRPRLRPRLLIVTFVPTLSSPPPCCPRRAAPAAALRRPRPARRTLARDAPASRSRHRRAGPARDRERLRLSAARLKAAALRGPMRSAGRGSGASVVDFTNGRAVFRSRSGTRRSPASVREALHHRHRAACATAPSDAHHPRGRRRPARGRWHVHRRPLPRRRRRPTFGSLSFTRANYGTGATTFALAQALGRHGIRRVQGRIFGDDSAFDGFRGVPDSGLRASRPTSGHCPACPTTAGARPATRRHSSRSLSRART